MEQHSKKAEETSVDQKEQEASSQSQTKATSVDSKDTNSSLDNIAGQESGKASSCQSKKLGLRPLCCFIVMVALAGVSGYSLYLSHKCMSELNARPMVPDYGQEVNTLKVANERQDGDYKKLVDLVHQTSATSAETSGRIDNLTRAYETMNASVAEISRKVNGRANEIAVWKVAEARFLTRLADRKLRIDQDYATAADLLAEADKLVLSLNDNRAFNLRSLYVKEITKLRSTPATDYEGIALRLMAMVEEIDTIKIKLEPGSLLGENSAAVSDNIADWKQNLATSFNEFTAKFIVVRSKNETENMLVHPENQLYLRENLRVLLTAASLAGYRGDYQYFQKNRTEALALLEKYFDVTDPKTSALVTMLREIDLPKQDTMVLDKSYLESVQAVEAFFNDVTGAGVSSND